MPVDASKRAVSPAVSVIIPTYRHAHTVLETLDSVFAQTFINHEIIVVNDGSPDDTAERLRPLVEAGRIRYIEQANAGQANARNRGLAEARGEFIAFLDDDDLWPPDKLEWQVAWLQEDQNAGVIGGGHMDIAASGVSVSEPPLIAGDLSFERMLEGNPFVSPGQTLIRKTLLRAIGGYDPGIWGVDDYDLWLRLSRQAKIVIMPRVALCYRRHAGNASRDVEKMYWNLLKTVRFHLSQLDAAACARVEESSYRYLYDYAVRGVFRAWFSPSGLAKRWLKWKQLSGGMMFLWSIMSCAVLRRLLLQHAMVWMRHGPRGG